MKNSICILPLILLTFVLSCKTGPDYQLGKSINCNGKIRQAIPCDIIYEQYTRDAQVEFAGVNTGIKSNNLIPLDAITGDLLSHQRQLCIKYNNCIITEEIYNEKTDELQKTQLKIRMIAGQMNSNQEANRSGRDENGNAGRDEKSNAGRDEKSNNGRDEKSNNGRDEKSNNGRDEKSNNGRDTYNKHNTNEVYNKIVTTWMSIIPTNSDKNESPESNIDTLQASEDKLKDIYNKSNDNITIKREVIKKLTELKNYYESIQPRDKTIEQKISKIKQDIFIFSKPY